jgi:hypothetical protein
MNKLISFLAIFSIANVANAEQINFTGHFTSGSGVIQVNDAFSGQFNFNVTSPDSIGFDYPNNDPSLTPDGKLFDYYNASGSTTFSGQQINVANNIDNVGLAFHDNRLVTQPMLDSVGAKINPGSYDDVVVQSGLRDYVNVESSFTIPGWYNFVTGVYMPPSTTTFLLPRLVSDTYFNLFTLLDANAFSIGSLQNPSYQTLVDFNSAPFLGFSVFKDNFSDAGVITNIFSGFGVIDSYHVTAVPVPTAFWLFGSAISVFAFRLRKTA